jgi:hypothetical protein
LGTGGHIESESATLTNKGSPDRHFLLKVNLDSVEFNTPPPESENLIYKEIN